MNWFHGLKLLQAYSVEKIFFIKTLTGQTSDWAIKIPTGQTFNWATKIPTGQTFNWAIMRSTET